MILVIACLLLFTASTLEQKFSLIEQNHLKPGSRIAMSRGEWNAWAREQAPLGVTNTHIELGTNRVTASANVDFLKLGRAAGETPNRFLAMLLEGDRPVVVTARVQSGSGRVRVDVERVQVGGAVVQGRALDFLIQEYVMANYPEAQVNRWFFLPNRMQLVEIRPAGVFVLIGK